MPYKQPKSLFNISVTNSLLLINESCYNIEKNCPGDDIFDSQKCVRDLKKYLIATIPCALFDVLCLSRGSCPYGGDPRIQLSALMHPRMSVFRKIDMDNCIPHSFWIRRLPMLEFLKVLDLKFVCTDEILKVIASDCLLLEELNIVSKVEVWKSLFNASVLVRNVSDAGICCLVSLKKLRILSMDPPRNERSNRVVRGISQAGIIMLVKELPNLEELRIESCDIGSTLISTNIAIGPLKLKKVNCHYSSAASIQKLVKICPNLRELSITHLSTNDKDAIVEQICVSNLRLYKLDMSFFSYTPSLERLLKVQGEYLTHFSLWEMDDSMTMDTILNLGLNCPNIICLSLLTQSHNLAIRPFFKRPNIFSKLQNLTIGSENFNLEKILIFFLECAQNLQKLTVKYQTKTLFDNILKFILVKGYFKNMKYLWLDCTLEVSQGMVQQMIQTCPNLLTLTVDLTDENIVQIKKYISENNLDLRLVRY